MSGDPAVEMWRAAVAASQRTSTNQTSEHKGRTMDTTLPEPSDEALGAAIIAIAGSRLPWLARLALRDGGRARPALARQVAARVERTVTARVREETTREINASWEKAIAGQAAEWVEPEPLPAFDSVLACPKCLDRLVDPAVRAARWQRLPESMKRTCPRCGYWWLEAPADAEALCATQSAENGPGDAADAEGAEGPSVASPGDFPGYSSPEPPGAARSHAEARVAVAAVPEPLNDPKAATEPSAAAEGGDDA